MRAGVERVDLRNCWTTGTGCLAVGTEVDIVLIEICGAEDRTGQNAVEPGTAGPDRVGVGAIDRTDKRGDGKLDSSGPELYDNIVSSIGNDEVAAKSPLGASDPIPSMLVTGAGVAREEEGVG